MLDVRAHRAVASCSTTHGLGATGGPHCHPTDQVRGASAEAVEAWLNEATAVPLQRFCAMSTDQQDQPLVEVLAQRLGDKVVPCFGFHPWAAHTISLKHPPPPGVEHYAALFGPADEGTHALRLCPHLPEPISLQDAMAQLRQRLERYPKAMLGEVGLDKSFRLPLPAGNTPGKRQLSRLQTPVEHQLGLLEPQLRLAAELGRSVSMHSVRAAGATMELLERLREPLSKTNIVLHSCTLSAQCIEQVQRAQDNVYISFSTCVCGGGGATDGRTINERQPALLGQIKAARLDRLLSESDYNALDGLRPRTEAVVRRIAEARGESDAAAVARTMTANFGTFLQQ